MTMQLEMNLQDDAALSSPSEAIYTPVIRFKGFSGDWEEKTLGDVTEYKNGKGHEDQQKSSGNFELVNLNSISIDGGLKPSGKFIDEADITLDKDDLVMVLSDVAHGNLLGRVAIIPKNNFYVLNQRVALLRPNDDIFSLFMLYNINAHQFYFKSQGAGMSQLNISKRSVENFSTFIPQKAEQTAIGNYFQQLDSLIAQHQHKHTKLLNLKQALLQKMFPQQGATVPEVRFQGFSGDWEIKNLGSLCPIGDIDHRMPLSTASGIPYLMTGDFFGINGLDFENSKLISNKDYEQLSKKIKPEAGDILFARYASVGAVRYVETDIKFLVSYSCAILKTSNKSNGKYLFYFLQTGATQHQIEMEINTGSQRNIGIDSLKELSIGLPTDNEQTKIGQLFQQLDHLITQQLALLTKLSNLKQAYLAKMFI